LDLDYRGVTIGKALAGTLRPRRALSGPAGVDVSECLWRLIAVGKQQIQILHIKG